MSLPWHSKKRDFLALGLMSGTSADGVDGALVYTNGEKITAFGLTHYVPYPDVLKRKILASYGQRPGLETAPLAEAILDIHVACISALLEQSSHPVDVIGFHGQTLFHAPPETYQIGDGQLLANRVGLPVVDQMRLNDLAHGGQGAPLIPVFHKALTTEFSKPIGILNIGGVANITWIGPQESDLIAFDIGPGNGLIDDFVQKHCSLPYDEGGDLAQQGRVNESLLQKWLAHSFFSQKPPKSLDRQTFHLCCEEAARESLKDAVATLTAFTAGAFAKAMQHLPNPPSRWVVGGGGAHNPTLLHMMEETAGVSIQKADELGWSGDALEAQAWGFLAVRSLKGLPLSFPTTTGVVSPLSGGRLCLP